MGASRAGRVGPKSGARARAWRSGGEANDGNGGGKSGNEPDNKDKGNNNNNNNFNNNNNNNSYNGSNNGNFRGRGNGRGNGGGGRGGGQSDRQVAEVSENYDDQPIDQHLSRMKDRLPKFYQSACPACFNHGHEWNGDFNHCLNAGVEGCVICNTSFDDETAHAAADCRQLPQDAYHIKMAIEKYHSN